MKDFIVAKITDKKWADKLLEGEIFFRPLYEFGSWNLNEKNRNEIMNNNYRGDLFEGSVATFENFENSPIKLSNGTLSSIATDLKFIDYGNLKYFKIFCAYCLGFDENNSYLKPDKRIKELGDTAVVFIDFNEFLRRILKKEFDAGNGNSLVLLDRIAYFTSAVNGNLSPLFSKEYFYSYQNEIRLSINPLLKKDMSINNGKNNCSYEFDIKEELSCRTISIGSIKDIAIAIPIDDFIELNFSYINPIKCCTESSESLFGVLSNATKEWIRQYVTKNVKLSFRIYGD